MPLFILKIKADLENIKSLIPINGNLWKFDISHQGEIKQGITVSSSDEIELQGSKGVANFVMKWPGSQSQSYIKIVDLKKCTGDYTYEDSSKFVQILGLECRGLEIDRWIPTTDFNVETTSGIVFQNADLSDPDGWNEYDENLSEPVSIMNLESRIERR